MIRNYLKTAWRNMMRNRAYALINIGGLAVGIAACLLIYVVVHYEWSFDKDQANYDRIYRVVTYAKRADGTEEKNPGIPTPAYPALKTDFPQFAKIAAIATSSQDQVTVLGNSPSNDVTTSKKFIEQKKMIFTQPEYFDMFNTKWLSGNASVLAEPGNAVINRTTAEKYFGSWKAATGGYIKLDNTATLKIAGVTEDAPKNSDFNFYLVVSYETYKAYPKEFFYSDEWGSLNSNHQVFVMLQPGVKPELVQSQLPAFVKKHFANNDGKSLRSQLLQPLSEIHFDQGYGSLGDHSTSKTVLWTLTLIGVLIVIMASINFINLSTAQAISRTREVGIRKVLGGTRAALIAQVLGETFLIVLFASILALCIAKIAMPFLSHVASVPAELPLFTLSTVLFLIALLVLVTLLSGIYPALVVSGFTPALALKSKISSASIGGVSLRRALVVIQFAIAQMLIAGTIIAISQMNFVQNADLGFNKETVLMLPSYTDSMNLSRMKPLKQQLLQVPGVSSVSFASDEVSSDNNWASNFAFDHKDDEDFPAFHKFGDEDYAKTFGLKFIAGHNYDASDTTRQLLVNETMVKKLGIKDPQQIVGKQIRIGGGQWLPVVGVVKDFKTNSLKEDVKPLTIAEQRGFYFTVAVKLHTDHLMQTTSQVQKIWEKTYPEYAYDSHFVEDTIQSFYEQETQLALLYKIFAGIAIFISCLGLYGLVSFMAAQKTKEVGIRKVLGAGIGNIVFLFSKEFTILIAVAFIISVPVAWYYMNEWLQNFVFRINIGVGVFAVAMAASLVIAWLTVGYKAVRAAMANPVKSLRTE